MLTHNPSRARALKWLDKAGRTCKHPIGLNSPVSSEQGYEHGRWLMTDVEIAWICCPFAL
jgi:hypothetical protein